MRSKLIPIAAAAAGTAALTVAGVSLAAAGPAAKSPPPMMTTHTGAVLKVVAPASGATVTGEAVPIGVSLTRFRVDCRFAGTPNRAGVGHYHVELDRALINMYCSPRASVSLQNVAPGPHTLSFIPAANDHADDLKAAKTVSFVYKPSRPLAQLRPIRFAGKPSVKIVSPRNGETVRDGFDLTVAVRNLRLSCDLYGKTNVAGYGHWHANVDSTTAGMMGMGTMLGMSCARTFHVSLAGIAPGKHRFFAVLEDNQQAPTFGAATAVSVNVK